MIKLTPPMGWNSWNTFGENINEKMIFETADVMAEISRPQLIRTRQTHEVIQLFGTKPAIKDTNILSSTTAGPYVNAMKTAVLCRIRKNFRMV